MKNILLIEDDKLVGITLQKLLKLRGYSVSFVDNGGAAIEIIKEESPDLIISDIKMAKLDGIETIRRIREYLNEESKTPIPELLITGYADSESYEKAKELEPSGFLYKPFDNDKFLEAVERIFAVSKFPSSRRTEPSIEEALPNIEKFFRRTLPQHIKDTCKNNYILEKFNQKQIMEVIAFAPPFLKIEKMVIVGYDKNNILQNRSIMTGLLSIEDTKGYYNDAISVGKYGWLMGSAASIYLAALFPISAPQVVEVSRISLLEEKVPSRQGDTENRFFIEVRIIKKKLHMVLVNVRIFFDNILTAEVETMKLILSPIESIYKAEEMPTYSIRIKNQDLSVLRDVSQNKNAEEIELFFEITMPEHLKNKYGEKSIDRKLDKRQIINMVGLKPPFLKLEKMVIFDIKKYPYIQSASLAIGIVLPTDTVGHYYNTIFLAMCGWLMDSAVSSHLAILFPATSPRIIEAKGIIPMEKKVWKPSKQGTLFFVETVIIGKVRESVTMKSAISFDNIFYGVVDESKAILIKSPGELTVR